MQMQGKFFFESPWLPLCSESVSSILPKHFRFYPLIVNSKTFARAGRRKGISIYSGVDPRQWREVSRARPHNFSRATRPHFQKSHWEWVPRNLFEIYRYSLIISDYLRCLLLRLNVWISNRTKKKAHPVSATSRCRQPVAKSRRARKKQLVFFSCM